MVACVILNMSVLSATIVDSPDVEGACEEPDVGIVDNNTANKALRITMMSENEIDTTGEIALTESDYQELREMIDNLKEYLSENIEMFWKDYNFDGDEQEEVAVKLAIVIEKIREIFPDLSDINPKDLFKSIFPLKFFRVPIVSVGYGNVLIPFYAYKTSVGRILRPIFINYRFGFSAMLHLNLILPRVAYNSKLGAHSLTTLGFKGLYINLGDAGLDHKNGIVLLVGSSMFVPRLSSSRS
ncbi:MAG: hypothetical protein KAW47_05025 [Thermoplasmatales archaeon]|nr:hypothetical protein [Thermoplasmatales archaeon]